MQPDNLSATKSLSASLSSFWARARTNKQYEKKNQKPASLLSLQVLHCLCSCMCAEWLNLQVTWIEHSEYDECLVPDLYRSFLRSGLGFGATRWIAMLQRQCEFFAMMTSSAILGEDPSGRFHHLIENSSLDRAWKENFLPQINHSCWLLWSAVNFWWRLSSLTIVINLVSSDTIGLNRSRNMEHFGI